MNEVILPPSPNWYFSSILACAHDGTISWGARNAIVVAKPNKESGSLNYSIIDRAHTEKVTTLAFSPEYKNNILRLVSGGDDNVIKIWNLRDLSVEQENVKLDKTYKVVAVDWSKHNVDLIAFVSENGFLVTWNIKFETSQIINLGKVTATCLSCCPHDSFIVSIGTKSGLVYVVDIRGSGTIKYKLRGHDLDIVSLSWCPVPVNVLQDDKSTKEYLLASGSKDRQIFIWKAGTDGRYQLQLPFPTAPLETSGHKSKVSSSAGNFTSIFWLKPTILLSSMPWGELVLWDLSGNMKKRTPELIHAKHSKSLFAIAALVDKSKESNENGQVENWRTANNIKSIWTVSQDRQIICCNLTNNETCFDYIITSQGGFVYCLDACPIDTTQIAFGVGDSMIRVWNLSEPNKNIFQPQMLWEKIKGKVRALAWHPEKENILAFATNEGRVGIFDTYSKKPPILYRQYHRHVVYTIGWGPAPDVNGFALYSCGDNELIYYNPEKINDVPTSVKKKDCTEFSWKSDNSLLAMGFSDGSISFYNRDLSQCGSTMHVLSKPIQVFKWHPISTLADSNISEMQNYLAVAVNSTTITIFDISINKLEDKTEKLTFKTVAVLDGHSEKVVCLAWSPHINGYLASGSYDRTVQVWKIHTSGDHEIIASYVSHLAPINCCMWSPLSHDLIITGSIDFSLRIWSISGQKTLMPSEVAKTSTRGKRTKKKKTKVEELNKNDTIIVNNTEQEKINLIVSTQNQKETDEGSIQNTGDSKIMKKKKMKKTTHFPGYSQLTLDNKLWCKSIQHLLDVQKSDKCIQQITNGCAKINIHEEITPNDSPEILNLFGSKDDLTKTLLHERKILEQNAQYNICTEIDLWSGNLKENLQRAQKNKHLNDFMVSLAPSISMKFWEELCEAYANQLVSEEIPHKAVSYFLIINKFEEAVSVLRTFKLYKEAYALLTLRLDSNDPLLIEVLNEWAYHAQKDGNFQSAIACYIKIGNLEKAANLLDRRNDLDSLILAIHVAETANNPVLTKSLADKAISKALLKNDIDAAKSIIKTYPFIKYREIEVVIFNELNEIHMNVDKNQIYKWLKGEATDLSLLDKISKQFNESPNEYSSLSNFQEVSDSESSIKLIQILVSRQIGLSILSNEKKQKIAHILKAADIIYQYEKSSIETKQLLLIKYLYSFDTRKFTDCNSIYNYNENKLGSSLRAYLCYALVSWYGPESHLTSDEKSELLDTLIPIFKTYVADLISKESVKYWTAVNEVKTLDGELSSTMGNLIKSSDEALKEFSTIEKLNLLKNTVAELQAEIICTPNPLSSYAAMMELVSEIKIENIKIDLTNLVIETMEQSYLMSKNES